MLKMKLKYIKKDFGFKLPFLCFGIIGISVSIATTCISYLYESNVYWLGILCIIATVVMTSTILFDKGRSK